MAQVLKDEIKENILKAALQEFFDHGYKSAAVRSIAEKAKIPTGLIYTYFKSKEALFEAVLQPVLYDWERVLAAEDDEHNGDGINGLSKAEINCLLNLFEHRQELIILMEKSQGTKYEHERERLIQDIEDHLFKHQSNKVEDTLFIHIVANNFVDGIMQMMYHYKGKEWAFMILHRLTEMYFSGIGL